MTWKSGYNASCFALPCVRLIAPHIWVCGTSRGQLIFLSTGNHSLALAVCFNLKRSMQMSEAILEKMRLTRSRQLCSTWCQA